MIDAKKPQKFLPRYYRIRSHALNDVWSLNSEGWADFCEVDAFMPVQEHESLMADLRADFDKILNTICARHLAEKVDLQTKLAAAEKILEGMPL